MGRSSNQKLWQNNNLNFHSMKYLYFFYLLLVCYTSFSQDPQLAGVDWYLQDLIVIGQNYPPPYNDEVQNVEARFYAISNGDSVNGFSTFVCTSLSGLVEYSSNNHDFNFLEPLEVTLMVCNLQVNQDFEAVYFPFFDDESGNLYNYTITTDSNENKTLVVTSNTGDQAIYGNQPLSNQDFSVPQFSIPPNPAKNELFITAQNTTGNLKIKIFNIEGKLLNTQNINLQAQSTIAISQLLSGLYFLNIEDDSGNTIIKKFVKE
tara:strand:- start:92725 stop:93510 length:786 start_codon:yes stop_codon:yes gene_type:complete